MDFVPRWESHAPLQPITIESALGAGDDDQCWCGSPRVFADCHKGRSTHARANLFEIDKIKRDRDRRLQCLHVGDGQRCTELPIRSHLASKSSWLRPVSTQEHVYGLRPDLPGARLLKRLEDNSCLLDRIGINKASLFPGFCSSHDDALFREIDQAVDVVDEKIAAMIGYRSFARSFRVKERFLRDADLYKSLDSGKSLEEQVRDQNAANANLRGFWFSQQDMWPRMRGFCEAAYGGGSNQFEFQCIEFDITLPIVYCGAYSCEMDMLGRRRPDAVSNLPAGHFPIMAQALVPAHGRSLHVMGWLRDGFEAAYREVAGCVRYIKRERLATMVCRFGMDTCESFFVQPAWYDALTGRERSIMDLNLHNLARLPHSQYCMMDLPDLTIAARPTRLFQSWIR